MPGPFFSKLLDNLNEHDTVISETKIKAASMPIDFSELKPRKVIRGD